MARASSKKRHSSSYRAPEHWEDVLKREFENESDRACVILGAALLDSALETLLRSFLLPSTSADDPLFDGANACLSTYSARIEMAFRLGLIDPALARGLHLVRRIRNDFAHNVAGCTFKDSVVVGRLTELRRVTGLPDNAPKRRQTYPDGPRGDFQLVVSWFQWMMRSIAETNPVVSGALKIPGYYESQAKRLGRTQPKSSDAKVAT